MKWNRLCDYKCRSSKELTIIISREGWLWFIDNSAGSKSMFGLHNACISFFTTVPFFWNFSVLAWHIFTIVEFWIDITNCLLPTTSIISLASLTPILIPLQFEKFDSLLNVKTFEEINFLGRKLSTNPSSCMDTNSVEPQNGNFTYFSKGLSELSVDILGGMDHWREITALNRTWIMFWIGDVFEF